MKTLSTRTQARLQALETIRSHNKRHVLIPAEVVEAARFPASPLHDAFEWDDGRAADAYRLVQARTLIREIEVYHDDRPHSPVVPFYLSLQKDRNASGGGYRPMSTVIGKQQLRTQLLQQVAADLDMFSERWGNVSTVVDELKPVLNAHKKFRRQVAEALHTPEPKAVSRGHAHDDKEVRLSQ